MNVLKFGTGRPLPNDGDESESSFLAHSGSATDFFVLGGSAWPSGHTAAMFSMVAAAHAYYREQVWIALVGYPLAGMMGYQMVEGRYHWLSDAVAGALIGWTVGDTIGRAFRSRHRDTAQGSMRGPAPQWHLAPLIARGVAGGSAALVF